MDEKMKGYSVHLATIEEQRRMCGSGPFMCVFEIFLSWTNLVEENALFTGQRLCSCDGMWWWWLPTDYYY